MANTTKAVFLREVSKRYGALLKLQGSQSLYELGAGAARIYIRYSKVHPGNRTFYGLREQDLHSLQGQPSAICFLWEGQSEPVIVPFSDYEETFESISPAGDGQYKVQLYIEGEGNQLYIANAGRFNVEGYMGWQELDTLVDKSKLKEKPDLSHAQVQTLIGSIGAAKGYGIWIPANDRVKLDWSITGRFEPHRRLPSTVPGIEGIISAIDVIWFERGAGKLRAFFEVEHSTPIYSALLRFNDVHLVEPNVGARYTIVSNDERRASFVRQLRRPTFAVSGLCDICTFLDYVSVFSWHSRVSK